MARISFEMNKTELKRIRKNVKEVGNEVNRQVGAVVNYDAAWGQAHMRTNAPWTDNTGAARGGLFALPSHFGKHHEILLTYSVYYGIWLEVANSGKYQILQPSLRIIGEKLMRDFKGIL